MMNWEDLMKPTKFRPGKDEKRTVLSEFKHDYSKIIFSSSFRRLKNKTQIHPLDSNDFIRTRLIHSLEVSTIASEIGGLVESELIKRGKFPSDMKECMGSVLEAASLLHDVGNPPFGHYGEVIIQDFFTEFFEDKFNENIDFYGEKWSEAELNDFKKFEGNAQTLRVISRLQYIRDEFGLNLTFPTMASIMKYPRSSFEGNNPEMGISYKKFGYFQSEKQPFEKIVSELGIEIDGKIRRHPLVFLLEASDDIAYLVADIEDAVKKVILTTERVRKVIEKYLDSENEKEREILDSLGEAEIDCLYPDPREIKMQIFRVKIQKFMINETAKSFLKNYENIMCGTYEEELLDSSDAVHLKKAFREILSIIISDKDVVKLEISGDRILRVLLREFTDAVVSPKKDRIGSKEEKLYRLISSNYRFLKDRYPYKNKLYNELKLVTDFICGMTDSYALELYQSIMAIKF
ncbi:dGTP triphosphohydrolase [uncultured Ilyobacter sp.]|uniref:dGTP triphosphohydrolase n=1 Tax=uncultured Ilyobacter sp. TaxID=544433 RepID=UPI002AA90208|nr:dNTP triphosphohydrolase [uncultured Ilyobacter sp.]